MTIRKIKHQSSSGNPELLDDQFWRRYRQSFFEWTPIELHFRFGRLERLRLITTKRFVAQAIATTQIKGREPLYPSVMSRKRARISAKKLHLTRTRGKGNRN